MEGTSLETKQDYSHFIYYRPFVVGKCQSANKMQMAKYLTLRYLRVM